MDKTLEYYNTNAYDFVTETTSVNFKVTQDRFIYEKEGIHRLFEKCYKDNLHSIWANQELYRKGNSRTEFFNILSKNMQPVYDSAKRQGYEVWNREK